MKIKIILFVAIVAGLSACNGEKADKEKLSVESLLAEDTSDLEISEETMNIIIESIPSPIEIAMILEKSGIDFSDEFLNDLGNLSFYVNDMSKAMAIGVYSGDLGYINIYGKTYMAINYLNIIQKLANDISIGHFFDFETIKRIASNNNNMDSLIYLTTINFNNMDSFLREKKRSNMSILMVTGTWLEGLYITSQNYIVSNNNDVMEWIGHQKVIVDQLILGLSAYSHNSYFNEIVSELNDLKAIYNGITITYEYHEPEAVEKDGRLVIIDKSTSKANITHAQVIDIAEQVESIRDRLVCNQ